MPGTGKVQMVIECEVKIADPVDWQARAEMHARALCSMLAANEVTSGTFGAEWLNDARVTLDWIDEPGHASAAAERKRPRKP